MLAEPAGGSAAPQLAGRSRHRPAMPGRRSLGSPPQACGQVDLDSSIPSPLTSVSDLDAICHKQEAAQAPWLCSYTLRLKLLLQNKAYCWEEVDL